MTDSETRERPTEPQPDEPRRRELGKPGRREPGKKPATVKEAVDELPRAKKIMLALAALFVLVGFGLSMTGGSSEAPADGAAAVANGGDGSEVPAMGLVGGGAPTVKGAGDDGAFGSEPGAAEAETEGPSSWSPFFVKGGFSFALLFCVGYAMRMFFKFTAFIVGVYALGLFGLTYIGWVDVDWVQISAWWDGMVGHIQGQAASFKTFITGSLPSAGLGTAGLITGFRKG